MNKTCALGCTLMLLLAGCFGDRVAARRTVSLKFPVRDGQSRIRLSVDDAQFLEALRIIDTVLKSKGFARDPNVQAENGQGFVASYAQYNGTGPRPIGGPMVYLEGDRLNVVVVNGGNRDERLNTTAKEICELLRRELSFRYGSKGVRVDN